MTNIYSRLDQALIAMEQQESIYQPTPFWLTASNKIVKELRTYGVESFRKLPSALSYFVPNYGVPASGLNIEQVELLSTTLKKYFPEANKAHLSLNHSLSGHQSALSNYRVLQASENFNRLPNLLNFTESQVGQPLEQWVWDSHRYSRSALNYLLGLSFLKKHLGDDIPRKVLEIGGGFGTLGEIWSQSGISGWQYIDIDIPPTQFVADYYLKQVLGENQITGFDDVSSNVPVKLEDLKPASVLCSWQIEQLQGEIDLFVNFISFQEMEPHVVENYLQHVDRLKSRWVLLRNMREGKQLKKHGAAGVETPIKTDDYVGMLPNYRLIARNVHPYGYETVDGFHSELQLFKRI
jgi:putative sugar O-methyltransferase